MRQPMATSCLPKLLPWMLAACFFASSCTPNPKDYPDLKIVDLKQGTGDQRIGGWDTIYVYYEGRFPNGKLFAENRSRGKPNRYSMRSKSLIMGWRVGILGMRPGGKRRLTIPPELAYGENGKMGSIPPNATLIFDIELVKVD